MTKLSDAVKTLINAAHARPGYTPASAAVSPTLARFAADAAARRVGVPAWVTVSTAISTTLNCPSALHTILHLATRASPSIPVPPTATQVAELIREVSLKCISFNGIPRSINLLNAFYDGLSEPVRASLSTAPRRVLDPANLDARMRDGRRLWDSVYRGVERRLEAKLGRAHPDLPGVILAAHYGVLLSDPPADATQEVRVGRVLTSLAAIACLRAQTGVEPQVVSHVLGLKKAYEDGGADLAGEQAVEGGEWLAGDEGNLWLLQSVDRLVYAIGGGEFAEGVMAKRGSKL